MNFAQEQLLALNQEFETVLSEMLRFIRPLSADGGFKEKWISLDGERRVDHPYHDEEQLRIVRDHGRRLDTFNAHAINGRENRISYVFGWGFTYTVVGRSGASPSQKTIRKVQDILDEVIEANKWNKRLQEFGHRQDRDGDGFVWKFDVDGIMRLRFIEAEDIAEPTTSKVEDYQKFGIETDPNDNQTVRKYYHRREEKWIPANQIQHRKRNADSSLPRGVPTFFPVYPNLDRADKIQRCASSLAEIQAAIAMIRKLVNSTKQTAQRLLADTQQQSTGSVDNGGMPVQQFQPGTILNTNGSVEYEFPSMSVDPSRFIAVVDSEIRTAAARLVMPEFMLASNANTANYASTMVAEGPAVKMFQRIQQNEIDYERELMQDALDIAVNKGRLSALDVEQIELQIEGPEVAVRDIDKMATVCSTLLREKILSRQTASGWFSLDYEQEQANIEDDEERRGDLPGFNDGNPPELPGDDEGDVEDDGDEMPEDEEGENDETES